MGFFSIVLYATARESLRGSVVILTLVINFNIVIANVWGMAVSLGICVVSL